ncbi:hypothetical protein PISMIDRAFT_562342 [Pisolithus microcarpus 441]|uniref:Uncharacterized protein n=1 Tax=Pisolithus microcarpus 441 TaxID=765257 RepID=A0A0C9YVH1_9AGAM|nr:hypothetical protein PISMIDRAFT_562342 [Pisolithus microcarpus 441]
MTDQHIARKWKPIAYDTKSKLNGGLPAGRRSAAHFTRCSYDPVAQVYIQATVELVYFVGCSSKPVSQKFLLPTNTCRQSSMERRKGEILATAGMTQGLTLRGYAETDTWSTPAGVTSADLAWSVSY